MISEYLIPKTKTISKYKNNQFTLGCISFCTQKKSRVGVFDCLSFLNAPVPACQTTCFIIQRDDIIEKHLFEKVPRGVPLYLY